MAQHVQSSIPRELVPLAQNLAALPTATRAVVVLEAERLANDARPASSWQSVSALGGLVRLGGDALADTDALYDG